MSITPKPIELNAGILKHDTKTDLVKADNRQGKLKVQMNYQGEKILTWNANGDNKPEVEIYLFAQDALFRPVRGTKGGRIFYLSFQSFDDKYFFWFQEPDASKDLDIVANIQKIIDWDEEKEAKLRAAQPKANVNVTNASKAGVPTGAGTMGSLGTLQSLLGGGTRAPNPSGAAAPNPFSSGLARGVQSQPTIPRQFQHLLQDGKRSGPGLAQILTPEYLRSLAQNKEIADELIKSLPENQQSEGFLRENLLSPQFQQSLESLESALMGIDGKDVLTSLEVFDAEEFSSSYDCINAMMKMILKHFPKK